jgi:hypothetical protein
MKNRKILILAILMGLILPGVTRGQAPLDSSALFQIETTDGNEYTGNIITRDSINLVIRTEKLGTLTIKTKDIRQIIPINPDKDKAGEILV